MGIMFFECLVESIVQYNLRNVFSIQNCPIHSYNSFSNSRKKLETNQAIEYTTYNIQINRCSI